MKANAPLCRKCKHYESSNCNRNSVLVSEPVRGEFSRQGVLDCAAERAGFGELIPLPVIVVSIGLVLIVEAIDFAFRCGPRGRYFEHDQSF